MVCGLCSTGSHKASQVVTFQRPIDFLSFHFLADRTATQYDWLLALSCRPSVRPSVYNAVHIVALRVHVQGF